MEAIIRTNDKNLFNSLLLFLKSLNVTVLKKEEIKLKMDEKKFNPSKYRGVLNHLNLDIEMELQSMKNAWKKRNF